MYLISIAHYFQAKAHTTLTISESGRGHGDHGTVTRDVGGMNSHTFAKDGEISYLVRHPTCVFHSSAQTARLLQTCWHTHLPSRSLSTMTVTTSSLQKMKMGWCLLSSSVIASATSAFASL